MAEKNKKGNGNPPGEGDPPQTGKKVSMTQTELDRLFQERADRASRGATKDLLEKLGYESTDSLAEALKQFTALKDAEKTALEKLQSDLDASEASVKDLQKKVEKGDKALREYMLRTAVESAARDADLLQEALPDAWLLISTTEELRERLSYDEKAGKVKGVKGVVKQVVKMRPHWVQQESTPRTPGARSKRSPRKVSKEKVPEAPLVRM